MVLMKFLRLFLLGVWSAVACFYLYQYYWISLTVRMECKNGRPLSYFSKWRNDVEADFIISFFKIQIWIVCYSLRWRKSSARVEQLSVIISGFSASFRQSRKINDAEFQQKGIPPYLKKCIYEYFLWSKIKVCLIELFEIVKILRNECFTIDHYWFEIKWNFQ